MWKHIFLQTIKRQGVKLLHRKMLVRELLQTLTARYLSKFFDPLQYKKLDDGLKFLECLDELKGVNTRTCLNLLGQELEVEARALSSITEFNVHK